MNLKTYRARSMSEALAEVKKDLGRDAVILHTRSLRVGGVLGVGTRGLVEVTAALEAPPSEAPSATERPDAARATGMAPIASNGEDRYVPSRALAAAGSPGASLRASASPSARRLLPQSELAQRLPVVHTCRTAASEFRAFQPRQAGAAANTPARVGLPATASPSAARDDELATIRRMLAQVLRRTAATPASRESLVGIPPGPLTDAYLRMLESEISPEIAEEVMGRVRTGLSTKKQADAATVVAAVRRELAALLPSCADDATLEPAVDGRPLTLALVGPTGVGKTTTVAKLAAALKLRQARRVGLITTDTYRIAAVEQLRVYAEIIGVPLRVAMTPDDMRAACAAMGDRDTLLIDTAGRSPRDASRLAELAGLLDAAAPHHTHLVLAATAGERALLDAAAQFAPVRPDRVIFTKLDESVNFGAVVSGARRIALPVSHLTTGQEVPDHIEPASAERLAGLVMDGWR